MAVAEGRAVSVAQKSHNEIGAESGESDGVRLPIMFVGVKAIINVSVLAAIKIPVKVSHSTKQQADGEVREGVQGHSNAT